MNRIFTLIILVLSSLSQFGQTSFNVSVHNTSERAYPWLLDGKRYLVFATKDSRTGEGTIYAYNSNGQQRYRIPRVYEWPEYALINKKQQLIVAGNIQFKQCDVLADDHYITYFDSTGAKLFSFYDKNMGKVRALVLLPDSNVIVLADHYNMLFTQQGNMVGTPTSQFTVSSAILADNKSVLVSGTTANGIALGLLDLSGVVTSTLSFPVTITRFMHYGQNLIIGLGSDGEFYKFNTSLASLGSGFIGGNLKATQFNVDHDTIFAYATTSNSLSVVLKADTSLSLSSLAPSTTSDLEHVDLLKTSWGKMAFLSTQVVRDPAQLTLQYAASLNVTTTASGNNFQNDLQLVQVTLDSTYAAQLSPTLINYGFKAKLKVVNKGSVPVYNLTVNWPVEQTFICATPFQQLHFNVFINPGDTVVIPTGLQAYDTETSPPPSYSVTSKQYCLWLSQPNGAADKTLQGNGWCGTYNLKITGIPDLPSPPNISVYPIPCHDQLNIQSDSSPADYVISDMSGRTVLTGTIQTGIQTITVSDLASGVYTICSRNSEGTSRLKIVKY